MYYGNQMAITKVCTKCGVEKPVTDFYKKKSGKFGVEGCCKECTKAAVKAYRLTPAGKANKKAWDQSDKAKASAKEYWQSPAGKAVIERARAKAKLNPKEVQPIPEHKVCSRCKQELPTELFSIRKTGEARSECRKCSAEMVAIYRNTEQGKKVTDEYTEKRDRDALRAASLKYEKTDKSKARTKKFRQTPKYVAMIKRSNDKRRAKTGEKLCDAVRHGICRSLKGNKKGRHWEKLVGYTLKELMVHLEKQFQPGMTWDNYGNGKGQWSLDHILPRTYFHFDSDKDADFLRCWQLGNLQPMWHIDNIKKRDKIIIPIQNSLDLQLKIVVAIDKQ
jgi:DNA-binding PadR family transcriptional regulator